MKINIARIVIYPVLFLSSATTLLVVTGLSAEHYRQLRQLYISRFSLLQESFVQSIRQDLLIGQYGEVTRKCSNFQDQQYVLSVAVSEVAGSPVCLPRTQDLGDLNLSQKSDIWFDGSQSKIAATVQVVYDLKPLQQETLRLFSLGLIVSLLGLMSCAAVYFLVRSYVVIPLQTIGTSVGEGRLTGLISRLHGKFFNVAEIENLRARLVASAEQLIKAEGEKIQLAREQALVNLSKKVAHDIRSPLSAFSVAAASLERKGLEEGALIKAAADKVNSIARDLLEGSQSASATRVTQVEVSKVWESVQSVAGEFKDRYMALVDFQFESGPVSSRYLNCSLPKLERMLSNLFQNALEARRKGQPARILIRMNFGKEFSLFVRDYGIGMPQELSEKAGKMEFSFGKSSGNGIGLMSANENMLIWGGHLDVLTPEDGGPGLEVRLRWP